MQLTISNYKCINFQDGQIICLDENCQENAITCLNPKCSCHTKHINCFTSTSYSKIATKLFNKHKKLLQPVQQLYTFIDDIIKKLTIQKQYIQSRIQTKDVFSNKFQSDLYKILYLNQIGLTGSLCFKVVQSLKKEQQLQIKPNIILQKIKSQTSKYSFQIQKILQQIKTFVQTIYSPQLEIHSPSFNIKQKEVITKFEKDLFKLSNNLKSPNIHFDKENKIYYYHGFAHSITKFFSDPQAQKIHFMFLQPGLDSVGSQLISIEFEVLETSTFYLGISFLELAVSQSFILKTHFLQGYFYRSDGTSISSIYSQKNKFKIIPAYQGCRIILTYNGSLQTLNVKVHHQNFTMKAPRNSSKGLLYFALGLAEKGSIKYLGVK